MDELIVLRMLIQEMISNQYEIMD